MSQRNLGWRERETLQDALIQARGHAGSLAESLRRAHIECDGIECPWCDALSAYDRDARHWKTVRRAAVPSGNQGDDA